MSNADSSHQRHVHVLSKLINTDGSLSEMFSKMILKVLMNSIIICALTS
ncbi:NADH dehydrogenase [ubiquinone] 1 alpha subcomplex subunit 13 [Trichinella spiralis]|nr:NADH dehydrogenase [ubiquinone] 1 alpha subcomplex subunit 13 [Trichinella spiralis]